MRKSVKRALLIITSIALSTAILAGCGAPKAAPESAPASSAPAQSTSAPAEKTEKKLSGAVMLYSSMQEAQLEAIKKGFTAKYPEIKMDYYFAGTGKVVTKIATEQQSGQVAADVIWVGDPSNYITFKKNGILDKYDSPEAATINAKFKDPEGFYCGARLVVAGFGYNTNLVKPEEAPKNWEDLTDPKWKGQIILTDPGSSGTSCYAVGALMANKDFGPEYFEKVKANGAELESGTTATHNKIAASAYKVGLCLDYVTHNLKGEGSLIDFAYPEKNLISITSPIAMVKNCANPDNGRLLYDYILSKEGQEILVANNLTTVRDDVTGGKGLSISEISARSMQVDDQYIAANSKDILDKFDKMFK
ncbi:ABC transporter substrate-binding protein [Oscillospiraceae bacterium PP1C4]